MAIPLGLLSLGTTTLSQKPLLQTISELPNPSRKQFTNHSKSFNQQAIQHLTHLTAISLPFLVNQQDALAVGGEFGLLEGRTVALIHPIVLGSLFFYTLYAGYLGWQWRRVRTIQTEINELKKQLKPAQLATPEGSPPVQPSPIEITIQQLTEERKELLKGSYKDRHFNAGSILLGFGVFEAVAGPVNTYMRTGKLFPGPHLYAGAAITVLWAAAAALVPAMQKGNETARNLHIALNVLNVLLFAWQIPTGFDIVLKVFEFTNWP
ncbi:hypothetical protein FRX31_031925 [Thalictrum thalictroides]|uniref:Uncharacterized protein n=1 Tax=Thalictrum thalictroides TaxID=46969 RepID=A0A7J6V1B3_THATH|nr:hypothetical protein FRX31_031925 [Thalictrum thalictroides]